MVALEHVKELDKQLKEEGLPVSPEASLHLAEITTAITELEADRRAAHEHLEVETIENSKLRYRTNNIREQISQEILSDIAAARASNVEEIEGLRSNVNTICQLQEASEKRQEALLSQNEALHPDWEQVKAEHEDIITALNDQITLKYSLQMQLDHKQEQIEELKSCITGVEQDKITLQNNMALEREAFTVKKHNLSIDLDRTQQTINQQKQAIRKSRGDLNRVNDKKRETHALLGELSMHMAKLESRKCTLTASRCQYVKQLEGEIQKQKELRQKMETLKEELCESVEAFSVASQLLKEKIAAVENTMEEGRATRISCEDSLAQICEVLKRQQAEDQEVRAEYSHVSHRLQRSRLQLEERIITIIKHSKEIKDMDQQICELVEADTVNKHIFERNQKELFGNVDTEKKNIRQFGEERRRLTLLLEGAKREQQEQVAKMTSEISNNRKRYEELRKEETKLLRLHPMSADLDLLLGHMTQLKREYRQIETAHQLEIQQCATETKSITRSNHEKQREVDGIDGVLKEEQAKCTEQQSRLHRLETLIFELRKRRNDLELSIQGMTEKTAELRCVETSIYGNRVKLEQVSMENSRLHLCIRQMTDDVTRARESRVTYWQESQQFNKDIQALWGSIQEGWREDELLTQHSRDSDGVLLESMRALFDQLKTRRCQLGNVNSLLHRR